MMLEGGLGMSTKKDKDDADVVRFEVSRSDDNKEWDVRVICDTGLDEMELGIAWVTTCFKEK